MCRGVWGSVLKRVWRGALCTEEGVKEIVGDGGDGGNAEVDGAGRFVDCGGSARLAGADCAGEFCWGRGGAW